MKLYRGYNEDGITTLGATAVFVRRGHRLPYRLPVHERHSSEHRWGYSGIGPAQLARDILTDHLGYTPPRALYQDFKAEYVVRWPRGCSWKITEREIDAWLDQQGRRDELPEHETYLRAVAEFL